MCHARTSTGSAKASDRALNASKKVALPTTMRARTCQRENGMLSRRPRSAAASMFTLASREEVTQLRCDAIGTLDGREMTRARDDRQGRLRYRTVKLPRHGDRRRVVLLADDDRDGHRERGQRGARIGRAEQAARGRIAVNVVGDEDVERALDDIRVRLAEWIGEPAGQLEVDEAAHPVGARGLRSLREIRCAIGAIPRRRIDEPQRVDASRILGGEYLRDVAT